MAGDALVDRSDECSSTCQRFACARRCPGHLGTTDIYRMIRHTQAPVGLLLTEQAKAQMHIVGSLMHCRRSAWIAHRLRGNQFSICNCPATYRWKSSCRCQNRDSYTAEQIRGNVGARIQWRRISMFSMASTARRGEASFLVPCLLEFCCVPNGAPNDTKCQTSAVDLVRRQY